VPSFSGVFLDCLNIEDKGTTILQNVWNHWCKIAVRISNLTAFTSILSEIKTFSNRNLKLKRKCFTESVRVDSQVSDIGA
jgi:hypothetical protein